MKFHSKHPNPAKVPPGRSSFKRGDKMASRECIFYRGNDTQQLKSFLWAVVNSELLFNPNQLFVPLVFFSFWWFTRIQIHFIGTKGQDFECNWRHVLAPMPTRTIEWEEWHAVVQSIYHRRTNKLSHTGGVNKLRLWAEKPKSWWWIKHHLAMMRVMHKHTNGLTLDDSLSKSLLITSSGFPSSPLLTFATLFPLDFTRTNWASINSPPNGPAAVLAGNKWWQQRQWITIYWGTLPPPWRDTIK